MIKISKNLDEKIDKLHNYIFSNFTFLNSTHHHREMCNIFEFFEKCKNKKFYFITDTVAEGFDILENVFITYPMIFEKCTILTSNKFSFEKYKALNIECIYCATPFFIKRIKRFNETTDFNIKKDKDLIFICPWNMRYHLSKEILNNYQIDNFERLYYQGNGGCEDIKKFAEYRVSIEPRKFSYASILSSLYVGNPIIFGETCKPLCDVVLDEDNHDFVDMSSLSKFTNSYDKLKNKDFNIIKQNFHNRIYTLCEESNIIFDKIIDDSESIKPKDLNYTCNRYFM